MVRCGTIKFIIRIRYIHCFVYAKLFILLLYIEIYMTFFVTNLVNEGS